MLTQHDIDHIADTAVRCPEQCAHVTMVQDAHGTTHAYCDDCYESGSGPVVGGRDHGCCDHCGAGS